MTTMPLPPQPESKAASPERCDWMKRVALVNDYVRLPYANGSSFASQFLFRELEKGGHNVTVVGPRDPNAVRDELPPRSVQLPSLPMRSYDGMYLPFPSMNGLQELADGEFDFVLGQTSTALMQAGLWLRLRYGVPFVMVNTFHIPATYGTVIPDVLDRSETVHEVFRKTLVPYAISQTVETYNQIDGLVVLSPGLRDFWRKHGVTVPIHVIPRAIEKKIFDRPIERDPFDAPKGDRLLVACRHVRDKNISRLIKVFARHIRPERPNATLTIVGNGPEHDAFKAVAEREGVSDVVYFHGERSQIEMPDYYAHADLFVYTSLSETFGQVVGEALWSGLPVVAFADDMGVSGQITHDHDGLLIRPGPNRKAADAEYGAEVVRLLSNPDVLRHMGHEARRRAKLRADPDAVMSRWYDVFEHAKSHCQRVWTSQRSRGEELRSVLRWAYVQSMTVGLGMMRSSKPFNSDRPRPPSWTLDVGNEADLPSSAA